MEDVYLRVISGTAKSIKLTSPEGVGTRPTSDRIKESIFSIILPYIADANVLDLFAGSGALGIEALSRGAKKAVFCEKSNLAIEITKKNIALTNLKDKSFLVKDDYMNYLLNCDEVFDIIFIDPPYSSNFYNNALSLISKRQLLSSQGLVITERDSKIQVPSCDGLNLVTDRRYGNTTVSIFKR